MVCLVNLWWGCGVCFDSFVSWMVVMFKDSLIVDFKDVVSDVGLVYVSDDMLGII